MGNAEDNGRKQRKYRRGAEMIESNGHCAYLPGTDFPEALRLKAGARFIASFRLQYDMRQP